MHYFIHSWHGGDPAEGVKEFADLDAALEAAAESARSLLMEMLRRRRSDVVGSYVEIIDEAGTAIARVEIGDVAAGALINRPYKTRPFH